MLLGSVRRSAHSSVWIVGEFGCLWWMGFPRARINCCLRGDWNAREWMVCESMEPHQRWLSDIWTPERGSPGIALVLSDRVHCSTERPIGLSRLIHRRCQCVLDNGVEASTGRRRVRLQLQHLVLFCGRHFAHCAGLGGLFV